MAKKKSLLIMLLGGIAIVGGGVAILANRKTPALPKPPSGNQPDEARYADRQRRPRSEWMLEATYNGTLYQLDPPESVAEGTPVEARTLRQGDRIVGYLDGDRWVFTKRGYEGVAWFEFPNTDQIVGLNNLGPPIGTKR